ncbi:MAG: sulfatase [archaeon]
MKKLRMRVFYSLFFIAVSFGLIFSILSQVTNDSNTKKMNVLLITFDAMRRDHLGAYGYQRNTSPNIDAFSENAILFDSFFTNGGVTFVSLPSMMSSRYPKLTRLNDTFYFKIEQNLTLFQEYLKEKGYFTGAIVNNNITFTGALDGFDLLHVGDFADDRLVTKDLLDTLQQEKEKSFFIWVHYISPHSPYKPVFPYNDSFYEDSFYNVTGQFSPDAVIPSNLDLIHNNPEFYISQYDGEIKFIDNEFGKVVSKLIELNLMNSTIIIISSDHGESLGEHGNYFFHGPYYDENFRVPMIIYVPGLKSQRKRIDEQLPSLDIYPTVLDILGLEPVQDIDGSSYYSHISGNETSSKVVIGTLESEETTIFYRYYPWKYITVSGEPEALYNLATDPYEYDNKIINYILQRNGSYEIVPNLEPEDEVILNYLIQTAKSYEGRFLG